MEHSYFNRGTKVTYRLLKWEQPEGANDFILYFEITETWNRFLFGPRSTKEKFTIRGSSTVWHTWPEGVRLDNERFISQHFSQRIQWDLEELHVNATKNIPGVSLRSGKSKTYDPDLLMVEKLSDDSKLVDTN